MPATFKKTDRNYEENVDEGGAARPRGRGRGLGRGRGGVHSLINNCRLDVDSEEEEEKKERKLKKDRLQLLKRLKNEVFLYEKT